MLSYYLVNCENKNPLIVIKNENYIHVKSHVEGKQITIITKEKIVGESIIEKTKEELQVILDSWIDNENENPEKDIDGNDIIQDKINLNIYGEK